MNAPQSTPARTQERTVRCPGCGGQSLYSPANAYRPFCSERCKKIDLGAWASEQFAVAIKPESSLLEPDLG